MKVSTYCLIPNSLSIIVNYLLPTRIGDTCILCSHLCGYLSKLEQQIGPEPGEHAHTHFCLGSILSQRKDSLMQTYRSSWAMKLGVFKATNPWEGHGEGPWYCSIQLHHCLADQGKLRDELPQLPLWSLLVLSMPWVIFLPLVSVEEVDWYRLITEAENLSSVVTAQYSGVFLSVGRGSTPQPCSYP